MDELGVARAGSVGRASIRACSWPSVPAVSSAVRRPSKSIRRPSMPIGVQQCQSASIKAPTVPAGGDVTADLRGR